jgi:two-component system chemotaxis response regulator CheY
MARILIVDDAAFMRMMLKDILTKGGFEIAGEAADGNEAVAKYNELKPDLVTLDITMPNKDGIQALKEIKAADPNATCVMCSAMGQQSMVIDAIQSGAKDFIVKPFQADRVIESIRKVLLTRQSFQLFLLPDRLLKLMSSIVPPKYSIIDVF